MEKTGIVYFAPNLETWHLDNAPGINNDGLTYEKEAIYVGDFVKDDRKNAPIHFGVDDNLLLHWQNSVHTLLQNGIEIPVPLEHTTDPTKNRGKVVGARIGENSAGKKALFTKIRFNDAEAAKLATSADISIFVPPDFTDGIGRTYQRPIRHVALTNYPTIPGLSKFQPIAASFTPGQQQPVNPQVPPTAVSGPQQPSAPSALLPLAQQLGVPNPEQLDDAAITTAIVGVFQLMKDKIDELESGGDNNQNQNQYNQDQNDKDGNGNPPPNFGNGKKKMKNKMPPAFAASFGKMLKDNRTAKIDALVAAGCILPAVREDMLKLYCSDPALTLSLDAIDENAADVTDTQFDGIIEALKKNRALTPGEKSGPQIKGAMALSNPANGDDEANILVRDAEPAQKNLQRVIKYHARYSSY